MRAILITAAVWALGAGTIFAQTVGTPSGIPATGRATAGGAGSMTVNRYGSGNGVAGPATRPVATPEEARRERASGVPAVSNGQPAPAAGGASAPEDAVRTPPDGR